jgi:hypothetical protein
VKGSCEHGNEPLGSVGCWEVREYLHSWQSLEKGSDALFLLGIFSMLHALLFPSSTGK